MRKEWCVDVFCGGEKRPDRKGGRRQGLCVRTHLNKPGKSGSLSPFEDAMGGYQGRGKRLREGE